MVPLTELGELGLKDAALSRTIILLGYGKKSEAGRSFGPDGS